MDNGLPEGVTLEPVPPAEAATLSNKLFSADELKASGVTLEQVDAPANSVFDQDNNRVLGLPQTLSATETEFVIQRDIDEKKNFFAMQDIGGFDYLGNGVKSFFMSQPQAAGALGKELFEKSIEDVKKNPVKYQEYAKAVDDMEALPVVGGMFTWARELGERFSEKYGNDEILLQKSEALIERNKKYIADAGLERPEQGGVDGFLFDLGQGGGSLFTSLGIAALTRSPETAGLYFGAIQKAAVYQEARAAGKSPEEAGDISTVAGAVEGGLEFVGLDAFLKALKGNSAVKRFLTGFAIEATQEGSQAAGEEAITQATGVRKKDLLTTIQDILYQSFLGGIIGGGTNATVGAFTKAEAEKRGMDEATAQKLSSYAEKNFGAATENLTEFIDKELAPIARDDAAAQEFITIMQNFSNNIDLVDRAKLDPRQREIFDQFVEMFSSSVTDRAGIEEVKQQFFDEARKGGVADEEADLSARLLGARADAASRAMGITPEQWLAAKGITVKVEGHKTPEELEAEEAKRTLSRRDERRQIDRNKPESVQRGLSLPKKPMSVLQFIKSKGGIHIGLTRLEVENVKAARKDKRMSASKANMASGELQRIFDGRKAQLGALVSDTGHGLDVLYKMLADAGYIEQKSDAYENQDVSNDDAVLDLIEKEVNHGKQYPAEVEHRLANEGAKSNADFLESIGIHKNMSVKEIAATLKKYREERGETLQQPDNFPEEDIPVFQGKEKNPRGATTFGKNGIRIDLFKNANLSTLLHELGHIFLRDMRDVAKATKRPMVKRDWETVKKFLGAEGDKLTVAQEEKFARAFEQYLREGKAPKPELQSAFDRFKDWLTSIYKSALQLNVTITPEIRTVFDRMLGADFSMENKPAQGKKQTAQDAQQPTSEEVFNQIAREQIERDYELAAQEPEKSTLWEDTKALFRDTGNLAADAFAPISTRLGNIDQGLKHAVRRFVFNTQLYTHEDTQKIKPFVEKVSNTMTEGDYRIFDLALKNRDTEKVEALIDQYDLRAEWKAVREVLDALHVEANEAGIDVNYIEDYFPRKVQRNKVYEFLAEVKGKPYWTEIEQAMLETDPNGTFTAEEKADFVNQYLRGFVSARIMLARPGFAKERNIDYITPAWNQYYQDAMPTLIEYIGAMRHGIEARRLFGKVENETQENIGAYVLGLVTDGVIRQKDAENVKKMLRAVVEPTGTRGAVSWAKNASYVYLMGNPISALTQIQDLAFSLHTNGYWRTTVSLARSLTGNQSLKKEDIGLENILQEFEDSSRASTFVRHVFKAVGLTFMDNVGKEVFLDASLSRLKALSAKNDPAFEKMLRSVFGEEANSVKADLEAGTISENVKYLVFSELSDVQPISLAEMPVGYLRGGNGRIFYMLKTYTVKQLDIYRREIFANLASGDMGKTATGMKNLVSLAISLMLMGMGSDALKNLILGREIEIDDMITDNLIRLMGVTKYQIYKSRVEGIANTFWKTLFIPPVFAPFDDAQKDILALSKGRKEVKDLDIWGRIPVVGKFYYWWLGGGAEKD